MGVDREAQLLRVGQGGAGRDLRPLSQPSRQGAVRRQRSSHRIHILELIVWVGGVGDRPACVHGDAPEGLRHHPEHSGVQSDQKTTNVSLRLPGERGISFLVVLRASPCCNTCIHAVAA